MSLERIQIEILKLIRDVNKGNPVGLQPLDRRLVIDYPEITLEGKLEEKVKSMESDGLIYLTPNGGYLLTEYGKEFLI